MPYRPRRLQSWWLVAALGLLLLPAEASARSLHATLIDGATITFDGVPKEWSSGMISLSTAQRGKPSKSDLSAKAVIAYDLDFVYVGAKVDDDKFLGGKDRIEITLGFSGGITQSVFLIPGIPGKSPGRVVTGKGQPVSGAKVIEAPTSTGYTLEAKVPWSAFPTARTIRVGLRGAISVHDVDGGDTVDNIVSNAPSLKHSDLPGLQTAPERALSQTLIRQKKISATPTHNGLANVTGDKFQERVLIFGTYLVVLGPTFRGGNQFYWNDMSVEGMDLQIASCETKDLTGDGRDEIILRKRLGKGKRWREHVSVLSFGSGDTPRSVLMHEVGIQSDTGFVRNDVSYVPDGAGKVAIQFEPGRAKGYSASTYNEETESGFEPLLLPWGTVRSQLYKLQGTDFVKVFEKTQTPSAVAPPPSSSPVPAKTTTKPAPTHPAVLSGNVYNQYKSDRNMSGPAQFRADANVGEDGRKEYVRIHDRDVVVFGPGLLGGNKFTFTELRQFKSAGDIRSLETRDVTGDGRDEILVRGVVEGKAPPDQGGTAERELLLIFQVQGNQIQRIFGAEMRRSAGENAVDASISFGSGKDTTITLGPGSASGWTDKTYPYNQDDRAVGGMEPLLLPWSGAKPIRYRWNGKQFVR